MGMSRVEIICKKWRSAGWKMVSAALIVGLLQVSWLSTRALAETYWDAIIEEPADRKDVNTVKEEDVNISREEANKRLKLLFPSLSNIAAEQLRLYDGSWVMFSSSGGNSVLAQMSAMTGNLLFYSINEGKSTSYYSDAVTRDGARDSARQFAARAISSIDDIHLEEDPLFGTVGGGNTLFGTIGYHFVFQIKVNGILAPESSIRMQVDGNGNITWFLSEGLEEPFPLVKTYMSQLEAEQRLKNALRLELSYLPIYDDKNFQEIERYALGYKPIDFYIPKIDALTGELLDKFGDKMNTEPRQYSVFQPIGPSFVKHKGSQLTADQALHILRKYVSLPQELNSTFASFVEKNQREIWYLDWESVKNKDDATLHISAAVDANNGQVLEYYFWKDGVVEAHPTDAASGEVLTEQQTRTEAIKLITALYPDASDRLRIVEKNTKKTYTNGDTYWFTMQFMYNDLPVLDHTVDIALNKKGEILYYKAPYLNDEDLVIQLQDLQGPAVIPDEALNIYINGVKTELMYSNDVDYDSNGESITERRPLYVTWPNNWEDSNYVDSHTGKLDSIYKLSIFKAKVEEENKVVVRDISNHWANKQLEIMVENGVLTPDENGLIHPDRPLTLGSWMEMMYRGSYPNGSNYYRNKQEKYPDVVVDSKYAQAVMYFLEQGWLEKSTATEKMDLEHVLTREELAESLISIIGYDKQETNMNQGQTKATVVDASRIRNKSSVSMVTELGLLMATNGSSNPNASITIAEASIIILKLVELQNEVGSLKQYYD